MLSVILQPMSDCIAVPWQYCEEDGTSACTHVVYTGRGYRRVFGLQVVVILWWDVTLPKITREIRRCIAGYVGIVAVRLDR